MNLDTAIKRKNEAITRLRDIYSTAMHFGPTSESLQDQTKVVWSNISDCPRWVHSYVEGYRKSLDDALHHSPIGRGPLVYGGFVGGKFYSTHRNRSDYYEHNGIAPSDYADDGRVKHRGHYWGQFDPPKPFFVDEIDVKLG